MSVINTDITINLTAKTADVKVYAKRLDDLERHLTITIVNGSTPFTPETGSLITFQGTKPDNTHFAYDNVAEQDGKMYVNLLSNGKIDVMLSAQVLAVTGQCKCEIQIEPPTGVVTASTFNINVVEKALSPEVVKSTDDYKSIYKMLLEVRDRTAEMVSKADLCSQKADEAAASAKLADDVVNCVPLANIADNLTTTTDQFVLSAKQGKTLNDTKVDKVTGKGLSTEDFTSAYKTKLDGIDTNANKIIVVDNLLTPSSGSALSANQGLVISNLIKANTDNVSGLLARPQIFYGATAPTSPKKNDIWMKDTGGFVVYNGTAWVAYYPVPHSTQSYAELAFEVGVTNQAASSGIIKESLTNMCVMDVAITMPLQQATWTKFATVPQGFRPKVYVDGNGETVDGALGSMVVTDGGSTTAVGEIGVSSNGEVSAKSAISSGSTRWIVGSMVYFAAV